MHHRDHHTGDVLFGIFVAGEIALHMAVRALHAESAAEGPHGCADFLGFQNLEILRRLPAAALSSAALRRSILSEEWDQTDQCRNE